MRPREVAKLSRDRVRDKRASEMKGCAEKDVRMQPLKNDLAAIYVVDPALDVASSETGITARI
jgi:hypothetical protein